MRGETLHVGIAMGNEKSNDSRHTNTQPLNLALHPYDENTG